MSRLRFPLIAGAVVIVAIGVGWGVGEWRRSAESPPVGPDGMANRGPLLFQTHCASCHGVEGRGDGATAVHPPPRDFAARPWRFDLTRESIKQVIVKGIPGTAMPATKESFSAADFDALVDHVLHLAICRPPVIDVSTPTEQALRDAGFVDLQGKSLAPLTLADAKGKIVKLADLKGQLVLINFWGGHCVHCLKEMPHLHKLEQEMAAKGFTVLHVCADADDAKTAQEVADKCAPGVRALVDESGLGLVRFEVQVLPTVWLISPDGRALGRAQGAKDWTAPALHKLIETLLPTSQGK